VPGPASLHGCIYQRLGAHCPAPGQGLTSTLPVRCCYPQLSKPPLQVTPEVALPTLSDSPKPLTCTEQEQVSVSWEGTQVIREHLR
jgi:hypothetical protein